MLCDHIAAADLQPDNREAQMQTVAGLIGQSEFVDGRDRISRVLKNDPDNVGALVLFANANARRVTIEQALVKLEEAMRLGRDVGTAHG